MKITASEYKQYTLKQFDLSNEYGVPHEPTEIETVFEQITLMLSEHDIHEEIELFKYNVSSYRNSTYVYQMNIGFLCVWLEFIKNRHLIIDFGQSTRLISLISKDKKEQSNLFYGVVKEYFDSIVRVNCQDFEKDFADQLNNIGQLIENKNLSLATQLFTSVRTQYQES